MARHDSSGQLNFAVIRQKLADATENAVMHASSGPDRRVHSNTDRRLRARLHHGQQSHEVIAPTTTGQLGMAAAGDRDSAYGTVISMAPSHCQSTFVLQ
jgi:hypothetical protein